MRKRCIIFSFAHTAKTIHRVLKDHQSTFKYSNVESHLLYFSSTCSALVAFPFAAAAAAAASKVAITVGGWRARFSQMCALCVLLEEQTHEMEWLELNCQTWVPFFLPWVLVGFTSLVKLFYFFLAWTSFRSRWTLRGLQERGERMHGTINCRLNVPNGKKRAFQNRAAYAQNNPLIIGMIFR